MTSTRHDYAPTPPGPRIFSCLRPAPAPPPAGAGIFSSLSCAPRPYAEAPVGLADSSRRGEPADGRDRPEKVADPRHLLALEGMTREMLLALLADAAREREWLG